jgi:hypothetical protein
MYGGQPVQGALFLVGYLAAWVWLLAFQRYAPVAVIMAIPIILVWSPFHAFRSARAWNRARGIES